ncbi:hypothetical protein M0802_002637 [Mischocyttarus mexicanus]|nr:hypothetical protein M0802_002637 [Mischocyttarus mexicanus]
MLPTGIRPLLTLLSPPPPPPPPPPSLYHPACLPACLPAYLPVGSLSTLTGFHVPSDEQEQPRSSLRIISFDRAHSKRHTTY